MATTFFGTKQVPPGEEEIAFFFIATTQSGNDEPLLAIAQDGKQLLSDAISQFVPSILGSAFRLRKVEVRRGSVEFWVFVAGGFTLISHYSNFVRSLELFVSQVQSLLREFFSTRGVPNVVITGDWTSLTSKPKRFRSFHISQELITLLLVLYLIASHAVLLGLVVRIVWRNLLK